MSSARCPSRHSAGHLALPWLLCDCQRAEAAPTSCQPRQRGSVSSQATHGWWGIRYVGLAWLCPRRNTRCRLPAHSCAAGGQAPRSYGPSFEWHVALSDMRLVTPTERARARAPCLEGILDRLWPFCALALEVKGGCDAKKHAPKRATAGWSCAGSYRKNPSHYLYSVIRYPVVDRAYPPVMPVNVSHASGRGSLRQHRSQG